ncbi:MAG: NCS2 family permease [Candidatus Hydrogenedentes bacterium]|nr:NCS2 family permease [Candidatus Hydrogenedentota bacterium]
MNAIDRFFGIRESGSTVQREVLGGLTTFATMSYIVFVQPTVLQMAGMPAGSVLLATCLASAAACVLMGIVARYPFALAPGMGENFFFSFTVVLTMGFSWQAGLAIVFIAGLLFLVLSLFSTRERLMRILPECLKNAIGPGIGLFIAFVGMQWGGIVKLDPVTMVSLTDFTSAVPLMTVFGVLLTAALMALGVRIGILIGILTTTGIGLLTGILSWPDTAIEWSTETFFNLNFGELLANWGHALTAIALLFFMDMFDTIGTLVGVGKQAGYIGDDGKLPRAGRAFFSDAAGTCIGALFGTSTVTSYVESATGVAAGARTGLAAVIAGLCFVLAILLAPVVQVVGQDVGPAFYGVEPAAVHVAMYPAVAPALIVVGFLMMGSLRKIAWDDITESLPAFLTVSMMVFSYAIHEGIAIGCISFVAIKAATGRFKEVHPVMYIVAALLVLRYAFLT